MEVVLLALIGITRFPVSLAGMFLPAVSNDAAARKRSLIGNQFQRSGVRGLLKSRTAERDLCFELRVCRNGSCAAVMVLMEAKPGRRRRF